MYAVKKDEIVLEGIRIFEDNLWNIPVQKTKLSSSILGYTPRHASLYGKSSLHMPVLKKIRAPIKYLPPIYNNMFTSMDAPIQVHKYSNIVDERLKNDRKKLYNHEFARLNAIIDDNIKEQYAMLKTSENHKLNVIIQKKEPKANLATFLHGACWSPVKSTFLMAIEKITSQLGQVLQ